MKKGRFSIAAHALEGYDRVMCELASERMIQRFVSPALFPVGIDIPEGLEGPRGLVLDALRCHFEGRHDAADALLEVALNFRTFPGHLGFATADDGEREE